MSFKDSRYFPQSFSMEGGKQNNQKKRAFGRVLQDKCSPAVKFLPNPNERLWNPSPSKKVREANKEFGDENACEAWGWDHQNPSKPELIPYNDGIKPDLNNSFTEKISNLDLGAEASPIRFISNKSVERGWVEVLDPEYPYVNEIMGYWKDLELTHKVNPNYMAKQKEVSYKMRTILVDWIVEVAEEYRISDATLHRCVHFVDRFLSKLQISRQNLQLLGTTCLFIACKVEEIQPPETGDLVYITDNTYDKPQLLRMECLVLSVLDFDLLTPTAYDFTRYFSNSLGLSETAKEFANYVIDLTLLYGETFLQFKPSVVSVSACYVAHRCCGDTGGQGCLKTMVTGICSFNVSQEFVKNVEKCVGAVYVMLLSCGGGSSDGPKSVATKHKQFQSKRFFVAAASSAACCHVNWVV